MRATAIPDDELDVENDGIDGGLGAPIDGEWWESTGWNDSLRRLRVELTPTG